MSTAASACSPPSCLLDRFYTHLRKLGYTTKRLSSWNPARNDARCTAWYARVKVLFRAGSCCASMRSGATAAGPSAAGPGAAAAGPGAVQQQLELLQQQQLSAAAESVRVCGGGRWSPMPRGLCHRSKNFNECVYARLRLPLGVNAQGAFPRARSHYDWRRIFRAEGGGGVMRGRSSW